MSSFSGNIEKLTTENNNFRKVLYTDKFSQLVVMSLKPGEDIGMEVHKEVDQFIRIETGQGVAILDGEEIKLEYDFAVVIAAGTAHNIVNTSKKHDLKLYTIYSPPNHPDGTINKTKADADEYEKDHHKATDSH